MLEFDVAYYLQQNPDVAEAIEAGIFTSALEHFQMFGMGEGRNPNPLFDVAYYLSENPDVAASGVDPLMHFNLFGAAEGRSPSPYFDPQYYFAENPDVAASGMSAIEHYLAFGAAEGRNPGPFFDAGFYLQQNEDVAAANAHPLLHWLMFGAGEERDPNAFFDLSYYLEQNSDVADAGVNGLLHFVQFGAAEGRFPTQGAENALGGSADNFDAEAYLAANPDVAALIADGAFGSAFEHFMLYGAAQGLPAQTTSGAPIDITGSGEGEGEGGGTGGGGTGGGSVTPPPPTLAQRADAIKAEWKALDDSYVDAAPAGKQEINIAFTKLGVAYVDYLNDGGSPILDRAKGDGIARDQSFHDNLLGNLTDYALQQRYGDKGTEPRDEMQSLVEAAGAKFLDRPYAEGSPILAFSPADKWDAMNGVNRPDLIKDLVDLKNGLSSDFTWKVDRAALESIETGVDPKGTGDQVIEFNLNETGVQESFARYQGAMIEANGKQFDAAHGTKVSVDFYIDPLWAADGVGQLSGVWIQMATPDTNAEKWSMIEYLDADASKDRVANEHVNNGKAPPSETFTGFRIWNPDKGFDTYVASDKTGWVNLSFEFGADAYIWSVDRVIVDVYEVPSTSTISVVETFIINSQNFGEDQSYFYDNIQLTGISTIADFYAPGV